MKELKECPICLSKEIRSLFKQKDKNLSIPNEFSLYQCKNCKLIFLNPQPSYKELEKYYSSDRYYSLKKVQTKEKSKKVKRNLFLYNLYFNSDYKNFLMKILFSPIKFMIRRTLIKKNAKLLDIGCGSGQFLYEMKELGMNVLGVEPGDFDNEGNKKYNLNIKNSDLIKAKYPKEFFDVITMNHVLEHLDNPKESIKEVHRILKKKGNFIIGVPNSNSLACKMFGKNWHQLDVPRHLINYSQKNLKFILNKNGFRIIKIRYNSRPTQFVVSLYFLFGIKKRIGILNRLLELIFLPFTWIVNSLKIGDQIEIWCVKK